jgi:hypothetical protein
MEEKVRKIEELVPEDVLNVFRKEWNWFVDSCSQHSSGMMEDEEDFEKYFMVFMSYPH